MNTHLVLSMDHITNQQLDLTMVFIPHKETRPGCQHHQFDLTMAHIISS
jgi:hypothetical protein